MDVILFKIERKKWVFKNIWIHVDKATDRAKSCTGMAALSDKGKSQYDGNCGDRLNTGVNFLYWGMAVMQLWL